MALIPALRHRLRPKEPGLVFVAALLGLASCVRASPVKSELARRLALSSLNLVPDIAGATPSYWCTWGAQNYAVDRASAEASIGMGNHRIFADNLTEEAVFGKNGWEASFPREIKKDLFIVFDLGWDIAGGAAADKSKWILGSIELATDKFPGCPGTPEERLRRLNDLTKSRGWKGAGLWIAAQTAMEGRDEANITPAAIERYFRVRAQWSRRAGIGYWKVDYGTHGSMNEFRQMLTRVAAEEAPGLIVENARPSGPLNDEDCPWDTPNVSHRGSYRTWGGGTVVRKAASIVEFSEVFRTYDVTPQLSIPTTIDRVSQILLAVGPPMAAKGLINCEDEPYVAAALGCSMGIMRHPRNLQFAGLNYDPLRLYRAIDEIRRAVRWQRIAPAFGAATESTAAGRDVLSDSWTFHPGESWVKWKLGQTVTQTAPAVVGRGVELPRVEGTDVPFTLASRNPSGAVTVATLQRVDPQKGFHFPLADVSIEAGEARYVGVFGRYRSLKIHHDSRGATVRILAQDLAGDRAIDISDWVVSAHGAVEIPGALLAQLGTMQGAAGDTSQPGLLLFFQD
jgi:hypothetical protein